MANQSNKHPKDKVVKSGGTSVGALASRALSMVAERKAKPMNHFDQDFADRLHDAAAGLSDESVPEVVKEMLATGTPAASIAEVYVPFVARKMGDEWCEDVLSFARVTIGTARLQSALHSLGDEWSSLGYSSTKDVKTSFIVVIVQDSYHTLGAVVLCGQLRRLGLSVRLAIGPTPLELRTIFKNAKFGAILISANETEALDSVRDIVEIVRSAVQDCPPIIVGGYILSTGIDIKAETGADLVTNDPFEALEYCGLNLATKANQTQLEHRD